MKEEEFIPLASAIKANAGNEIISGNIPDWQKQFQFEKPMMDQIMEDQLKIMQAKKEKFIKDKLIDNGFEHIANGMEKRRFTGVCKIISGNWEYWYANDGSNNGKFIVAIQMFHIETPSVYSDTENMKLKISFSWHEIEPAELKIP